MCGQDLPKEAKKKCSMCFEYKTHDSFFKKSKKTPGSIGLASACKECCSKRARDRYVREHKKEAIEA